MLQYLPDWFYGQVPPDWWPDRPREPFVGVINIDQTVWTGVQTTLEMIFDKRRDVLVYGACGLITDTTGLSTFSPPAGTSSQVLCQLSNPAAGKFFSDGNTIPAQPADNTPDGFVPFENVFSAWQFVGKRPVFWPIPIAIPKGGSLLTTLFNLNAPGGKQARLAFWAALIYDEGDTV